MKPLTPQQEKFAQLVAEGKSQAAAYREAYPKSQKWKDRAVWSQSSILFSHSGVSQRVAELRAAAVKRTEVTQDMVIKELARIAFFDIRKIFNQDGGLKKVHELDDDTAAAIASIELVEIGEDGQLVLSKKFKTEGKIKALNLLGVNMGMFVHKVEDVTDPLKKAMGRMTPGDAQAALDALEQVRAIRTKAKVSDER